MTSKETPQAEILRQLLDYEPATGLLTWKPRSAGWFASKSAAKRWNSVYSGKRAGTFQKSYKTGYRWRSITLFDKPYLEHRIVWKWMTGSEPPQQIDHLDRDATNNAWLNLKESSLLKNSHNQSMPKRNSSGVTGVTWHKQHQTWMARCGFEGKMHHLGYYDDIDDAADAVLMFRIKMGFNPEHGMGIAPYHNRALHGV
ncbi:HNH endonuclease [Halomonas sp. MS1]|nr:HNH endonuclease [Halomonas sp. MS1]UTD55906.1 HNH endonuclease [Halomonas sp. MS1]